MKTTTVTRNVTTIKQNRRALTPLDVAMCTVIACLAIGAIQNVIAPIVTGAYRLKTETDLGPDSGSVPSPRSASKAGAAVLSPLTPVSNPWRKTKATFYGNPYDAHPSRYRTADGTPYRSDGPFCATRLVPLGTVIEVRRGKVTLTLTVRDTQAKRFGHLIDIPSKTWDDLGAKRSVGMLPVEWRRVK